MQSAEKLYSKKSNLYHFIFMTLFRYHDGLLAFFGQQLYLKNGDAMLDAGCGSGTVIKALYRSAQLRNLKNINYYAFDITPSMLNRFKEWINTEKITFIQTCRADINDINSLPRDWRNFDLIVSSAMLEYLPKEMLPFAMQNLSKLLSNKGKLVIIITKENTLNRWLISKWWKANTYTKEELTSALDMSGFTSIKFREFPRAFNYLNSWGFIIEAKT